MAGLAIAPAGDIEIVAPKERSPRRFVIFVFLFALAVRLSAMFAISAYHIGSVLDHCPYGWEMGRVARSLVEGQGFASPMPLPTGPTAFVGPVYPLFLALIFKVLGIYSVASAVTILIFQCIFSSLTCFFIYLCGRDTLGEPAGKLAAFAWALFPLSIFFSLRTIWETSLSGMLTAALFGYLLPLRHSVAVGRWAKTGALLGITALINASLVIIAAPFLLSAAWRNRTRIVWPAIVAALACVAVASPWLIRNYIQFGKIMLRSNFPLEFHLSNNEWSFGQNVLALHPSSTPSLNEHWRDIGEQRFMAEESELNSKFLPSHHGLFAFSTLNRIVNYWSGAWMTPNEDFPNRWNTIINTSILSLVGFLGIYQMFSGRNSAAFMYAGCLFLYPLIYYVTTSRPRFYHAISPLLILCSASWVVNKLKAGKAQS